MVTRAQVVAEAREWVGTPFQHQQHTKQVATDCIGLVGGVGMNCGLLPSDPMQLPGIQRFIGYGPIPDGRLMQALDAYLVRIDMEQMQPGDVVVIRWRREPHHLAILADHPHGGLSIIHAFGGPTVAAVAEHAMDDKWRRRVVACFAMPGVN